MEGLIREQFPFQNALLSRESQINKSFYDKYDEQESFNEKKQNHYDLPVELMLPILFTNNANASYSGIEFVPERAENKEKIEFTSDDRFKIKYLKFLMADKISVNMYLENCIHEI